MVDRRIPDVWNIFSIEGEYTGRMKDEKSSQNNKGLLHCNWSNKNQEYLSKWCDRSSACDRPRTYDKFYQRVPGSFHDPSLLHSADSAVSVCSSEAEELNNPRNTKQKKKRKKLEYSRTITERDVKTIERHLSMKKTIRKKIMRDLQQAFVNVDNPSDLLSKENENLKMNEALNFEPETENKGKNKLLDVLSREEDSAIGSNESAESTDDHQINNMDNNRSRKFRSCRERSRSRYQIYSDSSESEENSIIVVKEEIVHVKDQDKSTETTTAASAASTSSTKNNPNPEKTSVKKSIWQFLTGSKKKKK